MTTAALDPLFTALQADAITDRHMAQLMSGTLAAVAVPGFLDADACTAVMADLNRLPAGTYDSSRVPTPIARFGPAINDYVSDRALDADGYWQAAEAARVAWYRARLRPDPVAHTLARLGSAWGSAVTPATIGGRPVFGGTLREINGGALIHYDDVHREARHLFDQETVAQLAFNVWVSVGVTGGETTVWRHRWEPGDEQYRDAYGYQAEAVRRCQQVTLRPEVGGALLFNPMNFHSVEPTQIGRRIAFAFFVALTTTGQLIVWS